MHDELHWFRGQRRIPLDDRYHLLERWKLMTMHEKITKNKQPLNYLSSYCIAKAYYFVSYLNLPKRSIHVHPTVIALQLVSIELHGSISLDNVIVSRLLFGIEYYGILYLPIWIMKLIKKWLIRISYHTKGTGFGLKK